MSTASNAMPGSFKQNNVIAPVQIPATQLMYWSLKRELWEYRSLYIAPLAVAAVFLLGFLVSVFSLPAKMRDVSTLNGMQQHQMIAQPYDTAAYMLMGVSFIVALYYSLESLQSERRDRSILFWKSLPVSDLTTVLVKASIPIFLLQLTTFVVTAVTHIIMLLLSSAVLAATGGSVAALWNQLPLLSMWWMLLAHLVGGHGLWFAPFYGWLLLVSAWSKRAAILWATLPLLAIGFIERAAFNTSHFAHMLGNRLAGMPDGGTDMMGKSGSMESMLHLDPLHYFVSPGLWIGLALTAAFLAGAVRLRRSQGPI